MICTPAERYTSSVSAFAPAMTEPRTSPRLQTATFICWPAVSKLAEYRAVISSVLMGGSLPKPHPLGRPVRPYSRYTSPTDTIRHQKNGLAGFLADYWPAAPLGSGGGGMSEQAGSP